MIAAFTPFPVLETERLVLRQPLASDDNDNFVLLSNDDVNRYLHQYRHTTLEETRTWLQNIIEGIAANDWAFWIITGKTTGNFMGTICLWNLNEQENRAELGYTLLPAWHRQGFMAEAAKAVIDYGFNTMKLRSIEAFTHRDNRASIRLLQSNGFEQDPLRAPHHELGIVFFIVNKMQ